MAGTVLTVAAGETETVGAGETQDSATVRNAGTFENAGTQTAGAFEFESASTDSDASAGAFTRLRAVVGLSADSDASTATLARTRSLQSVAVDPDTAAGVLFSGRILTGTATDIDSSAASLDRMRALNATGVDSDAGDGTLTRLRALTATAANLDVATGDLSRVRALLAEARDVDVATAQFERSRELSGTAGDTDSAFARILLLLVPESTQPVATIREILAGIAAQQWRDTPPTVKNYWDDAQSERGPGADMAPIIYVWQPTGNTKERFSMDGTHTDDTVSVELLVYSLDETEPIRYAADAENILEFYFDDNKQRTDFTTVEPITQNDYRQQTPARQTGMFVVGLEIELRRLDDAGRVPDV